MADTFTPLSNANQCPQGSYFFEAVNRCLSLSQWSDAYHQAENSGDTALAQQLMSQAYVNGRDVFSGLGGAAGNTPSDLVSQFTAGLGVDILKLGVIVVGLILVFIAVSAMVKQTTIRAVLPEVADTLQGK